MLNEKSNIILFGSGCAAPGSYYLLDVALAVWADYGFRRYVLIAVGTRIAPGKQMSILLFFERPVYDNCMSQGDWAKKESVEEPACGAAPLRIGD